ncbi:MAG TPA: ABC transporter substrate-binding protein [Dehalococcoidales bacterium]|nr:ABC transporter substrate-binding protein [Dehalococcoidales bacterium]
MKKYFIPLAFLLILTLVLPACQATPTATPATPTAPVTVTTPATTPAVPAATTPAATTPAATTPAATTPTTPRTTPATPASPTTPAASPTVQSALPAGAWRVSAPQQLGGHFIWASTLGITNMGSHIDANSPSITYPIFEPLIRTDENEKLFPWLAESWETDLFRKTITFKLRKGVKFHDGTDFNAEAVKYNLEQTLAANLAGSAVLRKISSYDIIDSHTIRLNLTEFDYTLLLRLAQTVIGQMSSPTAMQTKKTPEERAVGTGPFRFDSWKRDDFVKGVKFAGYWQPGKPYLDSITYRCITDPTAMLMAFKAGEIHRAQPIEPVDVLQLRKENFESGPQGLDWVHMIMPDGNNPKSPFADKRVREALEYAIDRKGISEGIGMGLYTTTYQMATIQNSWYDPNLAARTYDPARARQLLTAAGYPRGFKTKLLTDTRARRDILTTLVTYLKDVGIEAEVDIATVPRITTLQREGWEGILYTGFPQPVNLVNYVARWGDKDNFTSFYRPPGWQAKWDQLYSQPDETRRIAQLKELVKIIYDESIGIPLAGTNSLFVSRAGQVNNFWFHSNSTSGWYESADIWLKR